MVEGAGQNPSAPPLTLRTIIHTQSHKPHNRSTDAPLCSCSPEKQPPAPQVESTTTTTKTNLVVVVVSLSRAHRDTPPPK